MHSTGPRRAAEQSSVSGRSRVCEQAACRTEMSQPAASRNWRASSSLTPATDRKLWILSASINDFESLRLMVFERARARAR